MFLIIPVIFEPVRLFFCQVDDGTVLGDRKLVVFIMPSLKRSQVLEVYEVTGFHKAEVVRLMPKMSYMSTHLFSPMRFQTLGASQATGSKSIQRGSNR